MVFFVSMVIMEVNKRFKPDPNLKLMDQARQVLRYHHYAYRTEQTYCDWIVRYVKFFNNQKQPKDDQRQIFFSYNDN